MLWSFKNLSFFSSGLLVVLESDCVVVDSLVDELVASSDFAVVDASSDFGVVLVVSSDLEVVVLSDFGVVV